LQVPVASDALDVLKQDALQQAIARALHFVLFLALLFALKTS